MSSVYPPPTLVTQVQGKDSSTVQWIAGIRNVTTTYFVSPRQMFHESCPAPDVVPKA